MKRILKIAWAILMVIVFASFAHTLYKNGEVNIRGTVFTKLSGTIMLIAGLAICFKTIKSGIQELYVMIKKKIMVMKNYANEILLLFFTFFLSSIFSFCTYFSTGCTYGRWGFGSCGKTAILLPIVTLLGSFYCLYVYISSVKNYKWEDEEVTLICPNCEKAITSKQGELSKVKCSDCAIKMVKLDGFYARKRDEKE